MISDFTDEKLDIFTKLFDITETTNANIEYAIPNFITKIEKHFDDMKSRFQMNYAIEI